MGKQYISTVSTTQAHKSDITGVEITNKHTITVSSDGYINFWDNKQDEIHVPKDHVTSIFINKSGIHHFSIYENKLPSSSIKITLIAISCFNGELVFKYFLNDDVSAIKDYEGLKVSKTWVPGFYKDPASKQDYFLVNKMNSITEVYKLKIEPLAENEISISFEKHGDLNSSTSKSSTITSTQSQSQSFAISLAINQTDNKKCAIGYVNGDVYLYDFENLKLIYSFKSTDLVISRSTSGSSTSIPRVLKFSPGGTLLAVGRDNQSSGSITLYDVQHGENVGSLTTPSHSAATNVIGGFAHQGWVLGIDFDSEGKNLVSCGFDKCVRVWNLDTFEREATLNISITDLDHGKEDVVEEQDESIPSGVKFIGKGVRGGLGGDSNEGICVISFDRGIRWYREAGGV
ncbi:SKI8 [Candida pseudojiufengensis]|uniref:SKI8 n=1 Tax=Candida pseudojiufengensis TaxID=497109 RepID=UPI0022256C51|nr:SKI8 [Candida pseudojiufengensis]KAI5963239.1 SKI8 [Candida pseudojiufengensis]